jgi:septum formation protein
MARLRLVLASTSPRRRELLATLGLPIAIEAPHVDESQRPGEAPRAYARRLALAKASAILASHRDAVVIGADTIVVEGGDVLGKPGSRAGARRMLARLAGRTHVVHTAVAILSPGRGPIRLIATSRVRFAPLSRAAIARYVATGEPMDKAGGYALQGLGAAFVASVSGSVTNVIGLPLAELVAALERSGLMAAIGRRVTAAAPRGARS